MIFAFDDTKVPPENVQRVLGRSLGAFYVLFSALGSHLATPRCPQREFRGSLGDPWVPFGCSLGLGFESEVLKVRF